MNTGEGRGHGASPPSVSGKARTLQSARWGVLITVILGVGLMVAIAGYILSSGLPFQFNRPASSPDRSFVPPTPSSPPAAGPFEVVTSGPLKGVKYRVASEIPEATRRRIFSDLTAAEDEMAQRRDLSTWDPGSAPAELRAVHEAVAKSYGLDYDTISKIGGEDVAKGWPMPKD